MAPFALKRPGAHGTAGIGIVVLARNTTGLLIQLSRRLRVGVAGCRAAAGGHRGMASAPPRASGTGAVQFVEMAFFAGRLTRGVGLMASRKNRDIERIMLNWIMAVQTNPFEVGMPLGGGNQHIFSPTGNAYRIGRRRLRLQAMAFVALIAGDGGSVVKVGCQRRILRKRMTATLRTNFLAINGMAFHAGVGIVWRGGNPCGMRHRFGINAQRAQSNGSARATATASAGIGSGRRRTGTRCAATGGHHKGEQHGAKHRCRRL